jgi:hypothetical protein
LKNVLKIKVYRDVTRYHWASRAGGGEIVLPSLSGSHNVTLKVKGGTMVPRNATDYSARHIASQHINIQQNRSDNHKYCIFRENYNYDLHDLYMSLAFRCSNQEGGGAEGRGRGGCGILEATSKLYKILVVNT